MINFVDLGMAGRHQHRSGTGCQSGIHITANIPDHQTFVWSKAKLASGRSHQSRLRLAAATPIVRSMWAHLPGIEWTKQGLHPGVHRGQFVCADQAAGNARLVADHSHCDASTA
jgi:hypothetical protein